jgi:hypothetical protein
MSIITDKYFIGDINLTKEQLKSLTSAEDGTNSSWLDIYEAELLKRVLGVPLYNAYIADLNGTPNPTDQRFKDLVDGVTSLSFEVYGQTVNTEWEGLRIKAKRRSIIAYYVYYKYRNEVENFNSNAGQSTSNTENSERVSIYPKLVTSWNKMVNWYGAIPEYFNYEKLAFLDSSIYCHFNELPSVYNFLLANKETYPEWVFEPLHKLNIYGI